MAPFAVLSGATPNAQPVRLTGPRLAVFSPLFMEIKAIPTEYRGILFRSRLEAKWACMFDYLKWNWEYEPKDLIGYIPDFILHFHQPVLAEIKPAGTFAECAQYVPKIARSGWVGEALIFGDALKLGRNSFNGPECCYYGQKYGPDGELTWGAAELFSCNMCGQTSIYHADLSYRCLVSGCYEDGADHIDRADFGEIHTYWVKAGDFTRYDQERRRAA